MLKEQCPQSESRDLHLCATSCFHDNIQSNLGVNSSIPVATFKALFSVTEAAGEAFSMALYEAADIF